MSSTRNLIDNKLSTKNLENYYSPVFTDSTAIYTSSWQRPADWLALPDVSPSEQKFVGLLAVHPTDGNYLAVTGSGSFIIDWGTGVVESRSVGSRMEYYYDYNTISNSTITSRGYKQVIVTIIPQGGNNINQLNLNIRHSSQSNAVTVFSEYLSSNWLDINLSAPSMSSLGFGWNTAGSIPGGVLALKLERFNFTGSNIITNTSRLFRELRSLQSVNMDTSGSTTMTEMFRECAALKEIPVFNTSNVTSMEGMFNSCISLRQVPLLNTSKVTNFTSMFASCASLTTVPFFDLSSGSNFSNMFLSAGIEYIPPFNLLNATNCDSMFYNTQLKEIPVGLQIGNASATSMFSFLQFLKKVPYLDIRRVGSCQSMFSNSSGLESITMIVSRSTNFNGTFSGCVKLTDVNINQLAVPSGINCASMFSNCTALTVAPNLIVCGSAAQMFQSSKVVNVDKLDLRYATNLSQTFQQTNIESFPHSTFLSASNLSYMFSVCSKLRKVPPTFFISPTVTDVNNMFNACTLLTAGPAFNTGSFTNISAMYSSCTSLKYVPDMTTCMNKLTASLAISTFETCTALETLPFISTSKVTSFSSFARSCSSLKSVPQYDFQSASIFASMFEQCTNLQSIPIINSNTGSNFNLMFNRCRSLTSVPTINATLATDLGFMFSSCNSLVSGGIASGSRYSISYQYAMLSSASIIDIFNNLGTAAGSQIINITGNYGSASLSAGDRAIATGKGWTISG